MTEPSPPPAAPDAAPALPAEPAAPGADVVPRASTAPAWAKPVSSPAGHADIVRVDSLVKRFGNNTVLDGLTLGFARGKTTVVMGPSGTGKSVLLKHLVGLLKPDAGSVHFEDRRIDGLRERELLRIRTRFGFLFQMAALFDSLSVGENVAFPLREHTRKSESEIRRIVADKLAVVGLSGIESRMPADLSGGMKKRVALARAIALDPEVILYDEPTTGLDPQRSDVINTLINRLRERLSVTSIVVTHDIACVAKVADRVVMLKAGRIRFDGSWESLRDSPDDEVRAFVEGRATEAELAGTVRTV